MSNKKSNGGLWKEVIFLALSSVVSWLLGQVVIEDFFGWPMEMYIAVLIFWGIIFLFSIVLLLKKLSINYFARLQSPESIILGDLYLSEPQGYSVTWVEEHKKTGWEIHVLAGTAFTGELDGSVELLKIEGPLCIKEGCLTPLNVRTTGWGRYVYKCPKCSFKKRLSYSPTTIEDEMQKIIKRDIKKREVREKVFSTITQN